MFWLIVKKMVARFFFPVPLLVVALLVGAVLLGRSRGRKGASLKYGRILLFGGIASLYLIGVFGRFAVYPLETRYPVLAVDGLAGGEPYVIGVAGFGFIDDGERPFACCFDGEMLLRMWEAGRLAHWFEQRGMAYKVVVSVSAREVPTETKRQALRGFFALMQVPAERIVVVEDALNSRQEVLAFQRHPGRHILVSSAYHMPRLMLLARKYDLEALPAPVGARGMWGMGLLHLWPAADNLLDFQRAVYEGLGMLEYMIL